MEKYTLHMRHEVFDRVTKCMGEYIEADKWFPVKVLGDLMEVDLSGIFGNGNFGWSPSTLLYRCQSAKTTFSMYMSLPKPEEIPTCHVIRTVREQMEDLASRERPTLKDWESRNGIGNGAQPFEKACMQNALAIMRRMNEDRRYVCPEVIEQLTEMRTLIHTLIGTGENCCDETTYEHANVKAPDPNALFVTIETGAFEVTPENIEAVNSFISNACEGRDIHLRII